MSSAAAVVVGAVSSISTIGPTLSSTISTPSSATGASPNVGGTTPTLSVTSVVSVALGAVATESGTPPTLSVTTVAFANGSAFSFAAPSAREEQE